MCVHYVSQLTACYAAHIPLINDFFFSHAAQMFVGVAEDLGKPCDDMEIFPDELFHEL